MRKILAAIVFLLASGCDTYTAESHYANLAQARADHLFGRGWLPDLLPESSTNIRTSNNLDVNTSTGSFEFAPTDFDKLYKKLTPGAAKTSKYSNWQSTIEKYTSDGFTPLTYKKEGYTWVFFCHMAKGRCDYFMW